jgi:YD repeat-containing protein
VTDPLNHVTEYTYDGNNRMIKIKNRNGVEYVTNEYTTAADAPTPVGWVKARVRRPPLPIRWAIDAE